MGESFDSPIFVITYITYFRYICCKGLQKILTFTTFLMNFLLNIFLYENMYVSLRKDITLYVL